MRNSYNVLVTGVGAIIGYGIIRSLQSSRYSVKIIGVDIFDDAVGRNWCDNFERAIQTNSPDHPDFIKKVIHNHSIDLVIPAIEQDVTRMTVDSYYLLDTPAKFALNNPDLVKLADDKWLTYQEQLNAGIPAIKTRIEGDFEALADELGVPFLLKPRKSYTHGKFRVFITNNLLNHKITP